MAINAQNHASYKIYFSPIAMADHQTITVSKPFTQSDKPITFLHYHDSMEIGYCLDGYGIFIIGSDQVRFGPGDLILIPPGVLHLAQSLINSTSTWIWIYAKENVYKHVFSDTHSQAIGIFPAKNGCPPNEEVKRLIDEYGAPDSGSKDQLLFHRLIIVLTYCKDEYLQNHTPGIERGRNPSPVLKQALEFIHTRYHRNVSVAEIASACHISESGLYRVFLKEIGTPPKVFLDTYRVNMACASLKNKNKNISEIAMDLGFGSISSFNRTFRNITGLAPRRWLNHDNSQKKMTF